MSPPVTAADLAAFDAALATAAREDLAIFAQYVLRDEESGDDIALQPYHLDLLDRLALGAPFPENEHAPKSARKLVCTAHVESGKTNLGIALALWTLGRNPRSRIVVLSETLAVSDKIVSSMAKYISDPNFEGHKALRRVFPHLAVGDTWNAQKGYFVVRPSGIKDPSFVAAGLDTGILGSRIDLLILDDILTLRSCATVYQRKQVLKALDGTLSGRLAKKGRAQVVLFCNAQYDDDPGAILGARPGWSTYDMTVTCDGTPTGKSNWLARWPQERIEDEFANNPEAPTLLLCRRRKTGTYGRFTKAMTDAALEAGRGMEMRVPSEDIPEEVVVCIGVDFAFTQTKKSDRSAIAVVLRYPNGRRELTHVVAGKWREAEGVQQLAEVVRAYPRHRIRAESNGAQRWIIENWAEKLGISIEPYHTGGSKWSPVNGIPAMAADFQLGRWIFPCDTFGAPGPVVRELIEELHAFDETSHTGDLVMALFFADGLARDSKPFAYFATAMGESIIPPADPEAPVTVPTPAPPAPPPEPVPAWSVGDMMGGGMFGLQ
jgi:hypothetical protein